jgi:hypothetical protein
MRSDFHAGTVADDMRQGSRHRQAARLRRPLSLAALGLALWMAPGCTSGQLAGESPAYVIIDDLAGSSGTTDQFSNTLSSDVQTEGGVYEDVGRVLVRLAMKDPGTPDSPLAPTTTNLITLRRYHVQFVRADGRNRPGVDVPYAFDGAMTVTADPTGNSGTFVLVRAQSKLEAPLMALRSLGGAVAISTIAEVTFYGEDQAGRAVSVKGQISVNFADWADPE